MTNNGGGVVVKLDSTTTAHNSDPAASNKQQQQGISLPPDLKDEVRGQVTLEVFGLSLSSAHSLSQKRAVVRVKWYL